MADLAQAWAETAGTVAERIAQLRARTVAQPAPIAAQAVRKLWTEAGVLARAWVVASDPAATFAQRWHCRAAYDALNGGAFSDFDGTDAGQLARMQVYFERLMQAGPEDDRVLTPAIVAATLALGTVQVPEFTAAETDYAALLAAGLITEAEAGGA